MARQNRLSLVVLLASLTVSLGAATLVYVAGHQRDDARFRNATEITRARIENRLESYVTMLRGVRGLFSASDSVGSREFAAFVRQYELARHYTGVQGIGYAIWVPSSGERDTLARLHQRLGAGGRYRIWPDSSSGPSAPVLFLAPMDRRNTAAMGYDMFSEPVRRTAMVQARDEGSPVLSGRVELVQEIDEEKQPGFLIYLPVYDGDADPSSVAERRAQLHGFVYAPFRAGDLFAGIFGGGTPPVAFRVLDYGYEDQSGLLYDSRPPGDEDRRPAFRRDTTITLFGHRWTIDFVSLPAVEERSGQIVAPLIALAGLLVSLLLFELTRREVRARAQAQHSEQVRSRFYASMSHELRTPLNAIIGYNDLILAGIYGSLADTQRGGLERSQKAARHLLDLVNDVLDLSKIEAGKVELSPEPVQLPMLVEDLFDTLHATAAEQGSPLRLSCERVAEPLVSDPRRLRQILLNLLSNAIKFGSGRPIEVHCTPTSDGGMLVEVTDRGIGIAPGDQERIFEEFVQLDGTAPGRGTGLGLPISRRLARLLGGSLDVESATGQGSVFRLILPPRMPFPDDR